MEDDKNFTQEAKNAEILNTFFFKPVKNLKIPEFEEANPFVKKHVILKTIFKYSKYPIIQLSLLSIMRPMGKRFNFYVLVLMMHLRKEKKLSTREDNFFLTTFVTFQFLCQ